MCRVVIAQAVAAPVQQEDQCLDLAGGNAPGQQEDLLAFLAVLLDVTGEEAFRLGCSGGDAALGELRQRVAGLRVDLGGQIVLGGDDLQKCGGLRRTLLVDLLDQECGERRVESAEAFGERGVGGSVGELAEQRVELLLPCFGGNLVCHASPCRNGEGRPAQCATLVCPMKATMR